MTHILHVLAVILQHFHRRRNKPFDFGDIFYLKHQKCVLNMVIFSKVWHLFETAKVCLKYGNILEGLAFIWDSKSVSQIW